MYVPDWMPKGDGRDFEYGPSTKAALEPFRSKTVMVTGLFNRAGDSGSDGGGTHTRAMAAWLTGVKARPSEVARSWEKAPISTWPTSGDNRRRCRRSS